MKRYRGVFVPCLILFIFTCCLAYADGVPNAPSITEFGGKTVIAGETIYTNSGQEGVAQPDVLIKGSAPADTQITVYRDGVPSTQTTPAQIMTDSDGKWSAVVTMATGQFNVTATASNQSGSSLPSQSVSVMLDTTVPTVSATVSKIGTRSNGPYMYLVDKIYGIVIANGSDIDWDTVTITLKDKTTDQWISGTQIHDSNRQIDFYPTGGWSVIYREAHEFRITVTAYDKAGNMRSVNRDYVYDNIAPSQPTISHIYDQGTWKAYTSGMTVSTNPPKIRGNVWPVSYQNQGLEAFAVFDNRFHLNKRDYWTTDNGGINFVNGNFDYEFQPGEAFQEGSTSITIYACDSSFRTATRTITLNFTEGTPLTPPMPSSPNFDTLYYTLSNNRRVIGDPTVPNISGTVPARTYEQTVRIFEAPQHDHFWNQRSGSYNYSVVILRSGQQYQNRSGIYDKGEVYVDLNDNNKYDSGEPFLDNNSKGISDGVSYSIPNFLGYVFLENNSSFIKIALVNSYGGSTSRLIGRFHCRTTPPLLQSITITPHQSPYLKLAQKPTQIKVNVQVYGFDWNPVAGTFYGINETVSRLQILENNTVISTKTITWTDLQNVRYEGIFNVSDVNFQPQKQYTVKVRVRDLMENQTVENMYTFVIDTLAPEIVDIIPEPGSEIGRLPNFKANLWDTAYGELEGSGISFGNGDQAI
ncbi:MAG: hypothetical protein RBU23_13665, partial [Candidatus Auribacterota bacterium]|nr:hypothetical protein [Candidatus Auribacterota bacterium]